MSIPKLPLFSETLKSLREARRLSVTELGATVGIATATLYSYEARRRGVPQDKAALLRDALCENEADTLQFEETYKATGQVRGTMQEKFGSDTTTLSVASLLYPPFSGTSDTFCERFLEGILRPAVIKIQQPVGMQADPRAGESFSMQERMRWIEENEADIIVNLQHPMRMRRLKFLLTPIRVSLNGVILLEDVERIKEARELLVADTEEQKRGFGLVAVENEVGHIYLRENRRIASAQIEIANTLDAEKLADRLQAGARKMLVCDEITALRVVAAKDGDAILVLPPSTDQSILHFEERKLPVHYLGYGIGRHSEDLIAFLTEACQNWVSTEIETVAELLETTYHALVEQVHDSLESNHFLYSGGVRHVSKYSSGEAGTEQDSSDATPQLSLQTDVVETLVTQTARAFARRTLNIGKRSVTEVPDELWTWRHVLKRARERVLIAEARDRANVRELIVSAMKSVLGLDPVSHFGESYREYFKQAVLEEHWPDFRESLDRELDVTLPLTLDPIHIKNGRSFWTPPGSATLGPFGHLEWFVSAVQRAMEANTDVARLVSIKELSATQSNSPSSPEEKTTYKIWEGTFRKLWQEYCLEVGKTPQEAPSEENSTVLVAFSLGQAVGFLRASSTKPFRERHALEVKDMFVTEPMRKSGISRRLIRALIDVAAKRQEDSEDSSPECTYVFIPVGSRLDVKYAFERSGFKKSKKDRAYFYRLYGLKRVDPRDTEND